MGSQTHTSLRNAIVQLLSAHGVFCWANETTGIWDAKRKAFRTNRKRLKGIADILGILRDGRLLAIEVKVGKDTLSEEQQFFLNRIGGNNGVAFVAWSLDDVIRHFGLEDKRRGYGTKTDATKDDAGRTPSAHQATTRNSQATARGGD